MDLLDYFKLITTIPRPSGKEGEIKKIIINLAKQHNLKVKKDRVGNILVTKTATSGFEDKPSITIQGHLDMVCEQEKGVNFNFHKNSLNIYEDNGYLKAKGTTLGADNGVAVAYMLAIMCERTIEHPTINFLFTIDEERGLTGAQYISKDMLKDDYLINLDSEEEDIIYVGCAGGLVLKNSKKYKAVTASYKSFYKIDFSNLLGGHSGSNIHENRLNCIKLIFEYMLFLANKFEFKLCNFNSGDKHNVIPRDGEIIINSDIDSTELEQANKSFIKSVKEPLKIEIEELSKKYKTLSDDDYHDINTLIEELPNGVSAMSKDFENVVESSSNLASLKIEKGKVVATISIRSLVENEKHNLKKSIVKLFTQNHFKCEVSDEYPSWTPNKNSTLLKRAIASYPKTPVVTAIHAGLECGVLSSKKNIDMISIGPNIFDVHSPRERLDIASYYRTFEILCKILKN